MSPELLDIVAAFPSLACHFILEYRSIWRYVIMPYKVYAVTVIEVPTTVPIPIPIPACPT
jgi:hypothetical protein